MRQDGEIDSSTVVCNGAKGSGGCNAGGEGGSLGALFAIALVLVSRRRKQ